MTNKRTVGCTLFALLIATILTTYLWTNYNPVRVERINIVDSLNTAAFMERETRISNVATKADSALHLAELIGYKEGEEFARLNQAFVFTGELRYDTARTILIDISENSKNHLYRLLADVCMMQVGQQTASGKEFFYYLDDATEQTKMIEPVVHRMTPIQHMQWNYACMQLCLSHVSQMQASGQTVKADSILMAFRKTTNEENLATLFIDALCLTSMDVNTEHSNTDVVRAFVRILTRSKRSNTLFYEAAALRNLASILDNQSDEEASNAIFVRNVLNNLYGNEFIADSIDVPLKLAEKSLDVYSEYGNKYYTLASLVTLSNLNARRGNYENAEELLIHALEEVSKQNPHHTEGEMLLPYDTISNVIPLEMRWIGEKDNVCTPNLMATIRESLSLLYAKMGNKYASDYNRNVYLDIIDAILHDHQAEQLLEKNENKKHLLNMLLWCIIALSLLFLTIYLYFKNKIKSKTRIESEGLERIINTVLKEQQAKHIEPIYYASEVKRLYKNLQKWDESVKSEIEKLECLDEELNAETYSSQRKIADNKRTYIDKSVSLTIIGSITSFLERAIREIDKVVSLRFAKPTQERTDAINSGLQYATELAEQIEHLNGLFSAWVSVKRGAVQMDLDDVELQSVFDIAMKSRVLFNKRSITLNVVSTDCVVRTDKALTLFMINTLLDNARKFTPDGGTVTLSATHIDGGLVRVSITDTGHGISAADITTLLNTKVYDSSSIGMDSDASKDIKANKGFGFGLMNCRGIIEKYRQTGKGYDQCTFNISSTIGKGSTFSFDLLSSCEAERMRQERLNSHKRPVVNMMLILAVAFTTLFQLSAQANETAVNQQALGSTADKIDSDHKLSQLIDSLYNCNIRGEYETTLVFADSALKRLNRLYHVQPDDSLSVSGQRMSDLKLIGTDGDVPTSLIMLRNEVAIAAMSLNRPDIYQYNNTLYTRLNSIASRPRLDVEIEKSGKHNALMMTIIITLAIFLFVILMTTIMRYYRHYLVQLLNYRQTITFLADFFEANDCDISSQLYNGISNIHNAKGMIMGLSNAQNLLTYTMLGDTQNDEDWIKNIIELAWKTNKPASVVLSDNTTLLPITHTKTDGTTINIGIVAILWNSESTLSASDKHMCEWYIAAFAMRMYHSTLTLAELSEGIEILKDRHARTVFEENRIHVRNQILDNSLSAIKHETMYYPTRLLQLLRQSASQEDKTATIQDLYELAHYYKEVFMLIYGRANQQTSSGIFKKEHITVKTLYASIQRNFKKLTAKHRRNIQCELVETTVPMLISGDMNILEYLAESIVRIAFLCDSCQRFRMYVEENECFVIINAEYYGMTMTDEEAQHRFNPESLIIDTHTGEMHGTEYLILRQIIREHDQYATNRGCRAGVQNTSFGTLVTLTLPKVRLTRC